MSDWCQIQDVSAHDVVRATRDAQAAYDDLQQQNYLPAEGDLHPVLGYESTAQSIGVLGNIIVDPVTMSCLSREQITAVVAHEAGHQNAPSNLITMADIGGVQMYMLMAMGIVGAARMAKAAAFRLAGHRRPTHIKDSPVICVLALIHAGIGMHAADIHQQGERAADHFAVQYMQDPEPLATGLERLNNIDYGHAGGLSLLDFANPRFLGLVIKTKAPELIIYGPIGMNFLYPSDEERLAHIRTTPLDGARPEPGHIFVPPPPAQDGLQ